MPDLTLLTIWVGLLGLCVGSFLNVVIYRLPIIIKNQVVRDHMTLSQSLVLETKINLCLPRSFCPNCRQNIPYRFNIPILGFLLLKGKSTCCNKPISSHYLLVELVTCLLSMALTLHFGGTVQLVAGLVFSWAAIVLFFIDSKEQLLPDLLTIPFLWIGLVFNIFETFTSLSSAVLGSIFGYLFFFLVAGIFKLIRKVEGIGRGDFKFFAMLGAWFGWQSLPAIAFIASCCGLIFAISSIIMIKKMNYHTPIPFGPFLVIAGFIILIGGNSALFSLLDFFRNC